MYYQISGNDSWSDSGHWIMIVLATTPSEAKTIAKKHLKTINRSDLTIGSCKKLTRTDNILISTVETTNSEIVEK